MIDFTNFHDATKGLFVNCNQPKHNPDYISESGSEYWDTGEGVIRYADHWEDQRSCSWHHEKGINHVGYGYIRYSDLNIKKDNPYLAYCMRIRY